MEVSILSVLLLCVLLWCAVYVCLRTGWSWLATPVGLSVVKLRSDIMANNLRYSVSVAAPVDADVVKRVLTVGVDYTDRDPVEFDGTTTDLGEIVVPQDSQVTLTLVDVDDAGNESEPARLAFTATDTLPPQQPGALGVMLVSEETDN